MNASVPLSPQPLCARSRSGGSRNRRAPPGSSQHKALQVHRHPQVLPWPSSSLRLSGTTAGLRRREERSPEGGGGGSSGQARGIACQQRNQQSAWSWTGHTAPASSHLFFCIDAVSFAQDTAVNFPVLHRHIGSGCSEHGLSPVPTTGDLQTQDRARNVPAQTQTPFFWPSWLQLAQFLPRSELRSTQQ